MKIRMPVVAERPVINSPSAVADILRKVLKSEDTADQDKEHFWVLGFTTKLTLKFVDLASLGVLDTALAHPREVFRSAIAEGVSSVIIAHNHPSGDPTPSHEDERLSHRLLRAGEIVGINVMDHVVVAENDFYSFQENSRWPVMPAFPSTYRPSPEEGAEEKIRELFKENAILKQRLEALRLQLDSLQTAVRSRLGAKGAEAGIASKGLSKKTQGNKVAEKEHRGGVTHG